MTRDRKQHSLLLVALLTTTVAAMCMHGAASAQTSARLTQPERILIQREGNSAAPIALRNKQLLRRVRGAERSLEIFELPAGTDRESVLRELRSQLGVEFAVLETRKRIHRDAGDALYAQQWYLHSVSEPSAIAANIAWDLTTGSNGVVVAVLDTGVRFDHLDSNPDRLAVAGTQKDVHHRSGSDLREGQRLHPWHYPLGNRQTT